jgi:FlaG/FlaF family flagellin (archaellin)
MKKTHATILWVAVAVIVTGFLYFWVGGGNKTADLSPKALIEGAAVVEEGVR